MLAFFLPHSPATSRRSQALNAVPSAVSEGKSHIGHHQKSLRGAAGVRDQHLSSLLEWPLREEVGLRGKALRSGTVDSSCAQ